jgi:hypothetical protein
MSKKKYYKAVPELLAVYKAAKVLLKKCDDEFCMNQASAISCLSISIEELEEKHGVDNQRSKVIRDSYKALHKSHGDLS